MHMFEGRTAREVTVKIFERSEYAQELISVGRATYVGRVKAQKAEHCLVAGIFCQQD